MGQRFPSVSEIYFLKKWIIGRSVSDRARFCAILSWPAPDGRTAKRVMKRMINKMLFARNSYNFLDRYYTL